MIVDVQIAWGLRHRLGLAVAAQFGGVPNLVGFTVLLFPGQAVQPLGTEVVLCVGRCLRLPLD